MKRLSLTLTGIFFLGLLQYHLWLGSGGILSTRRLQAQLNAQRIATDKLQQENSQLANDIRHWKTNDLSLLEGYARSYLGMIKSGELFYQFAEPSS